MKKVLSLLVVVLMALFSAFSVKADNADRAYEENVRGFEVDIYSNYQELPLYSNAKRSSVFEDYGIKIYLKPGESWTIQPPNIPDFQVSSLERNFLKDNTTWGTSTDEIQVPFTVHYDDLQEPLYTNSDGTVQILDRFVLHMENLNRKRIKKLQVIVREDGDSEAVFETETVFKKEVEPNYEMIAIEGQLLSFDNDYIPGKAIIGFKFYKPGSLSKEFNESIPWDPEALGDPSYVVVYYGDPEESTFVNADGWTAWDLSTLPGNNEPEETTEETTEEETTVEDTEVVETVVYEERDNSAVAIIAIALVVLLAGGGGIAIYSAQKKNKQ